MPFPVALDRKIRLRFDELIAEVEVQGLQRDEYDVAPISRRYQHGM